MRILFFILLTTTCFSQNNVKGFYLGFSPNATFSKVTENDVLNGLKAKPGIALGLQIGYQYPINNRFSLSAELNSVFTSYRSAYIPYDFRTAYTKLFHQAKIKVYHNIPLNEKTTFVSNLGISVDLLVSYSKSKTILWDSLRSITITEYSKPVNNLYISLGLGILKHRKKRDKYIGISFSKGLFTNFFQKITYFTNNISYVSAIEGSNTHLSVDFILYLKKKKQSTK